MIYAYDQNVQLPVKDLYDNQVVAMSIAAAKDMYEKGQQELKDFKKEFGDFYSPFQKDMQRYGQMIQGVKDVINNLYANGIDPVRNPAGRAAISRAISNIDPAEFNNMRANAKTGLAYQEAMQKLMAQGKYDPMMQDYYLRSQGIPSFQDFSSAGGNTWTQVSPMEAINLRDLTAPGFAHRTAHELTKEQAQKWMGKSYDPRAKYTGFTYDDVYDTAGTLVPGLRGDWRAEYFKDISRQKALAQNPNATQTDIDKQFQRDIAEANRQWIIDPTGNLSDWYNEQKLGIENRKLGLEGQRLIQSQRNADRSFALEMAKAGVSIDPRTGRLVKLSPEMMDGYPQPVEQRQIDKQVHGRAEALADYRNVFGTMLEQQKEIIAKYEKEKNASKLGYKEEKVPFMGSTLPGGGNTIAQYTTKRTPYIMNANSEARLEKLRKNAETAEYNIREIEKILNGGVEVLKRKKYLDANGYPTPAYTKLVAKVQLGKETMKNLTEQQQYDRVNKLFGQLYSAGDLANGDFRKWRDSNFASGKEQTLPGTKDMKVITTTTGQYRYAPVYKNAAFGRNSGSSSMQNRLDSWLADNKVAYDIVGSKKQDYFAPTTKGESYVTQGSILVSEEDLQDFATQYGYKLKDVISSQRLKEHKFQKESTGTSQFIKYYEIPVMKDLHNNGGFNYYRINESVNKSDFGAKQSAEDRNDAILQSVMN